MIKLKRYITVFVFLLLLLASTNYYIVNSKSANTINKNNKNITLKIPFKYFFRGFISLKYSQETTYPHDTYIIESDKDWHDFMDKYCPGIPYYELVDYSKECLVFDAAFPARPTYTNASDIKTFITDNNKFEAEYVNQGSMGISNGIYAQNVNGIEHCFINIVKISKKYIPKSVKNIYYAGEVFRN